MSFGIVVYYHWEAMLVSYLSTRVIKLPFTGIKGMVENTDYRLALIPGSSFMDAFKYSTIPEWQEAWKTRIEPYLDDYKGYPEMIDLPMGDPSLALYDNFFSASYIDRLELVNVIPY